MIGRVMTPEERIAELLEDKRNLFAALEESEGELFVLRDVVNLFASTLKFLSMNGSYGSDVNNLTKDVLQEASKVYKSLSE